MRGEPSDLRPDGPRRLASLVVFLLVAVAVARVTGELWAVSLASDDFPQWDAAKYGVAGVRLAAAIRDADPAAFAGGVNRLSPWPPLFPLAEAPVFLALGGDYRVAEGFVGALFLLAALVAFWAGRWVVAAGLAPARSGGDRWLGALLPELAGALTALLVLTSSIFHLFGTLVMLEVPGALLVLAAAGAYARSLAAGRDRRGGPAKGFRLACAAAAGLFFLKYNYGLLWLAPLGLSELWLASGEEGPLRRSARWGRERWRAIDLRRPWTWFLAACGALLAGIAITGGWELRLGGSTFHLQSLGNPIYALYLLMLLRHLAWPRRRRALLDRLRRLEPRARTAALWIALPIAVWFLVPPHVKDFFKFVENRSSGFPFWSLETLALYPRAFVAEFAPHPAIGVAALLLAAAPFLYLRRLPPAHRALALALVVGAAALVLHPYKQPRFLFPLAPLVWLAAAATLADALGALGARARQAGRAVRIPSAITAAVAVGGLAAWLGWTAVAGGVDRERLAARHADQTVPADVAPLLDALADTAAASAGNVLVGAWNDLSPALVEWHCRLRHPGIPAARIPREADRLVPAASPLRLLDRAASPGSGIERLLVVGALGDGPRGAATFRTETAWLDPVREALATDRRFTLEADRPFPAAGYRLRVYGLAPAPGRAAAPH